MALSKHMLKRLIEEDGHLVLEGDESTEELRRAAINLFCHYPMECRNRYSGIPIAIAVPDLSVFGPNSTYRHPRKRVISKARETSDVLDSL